MGLGDTKIRKEQRDRFRRSPAAWIVKWSRSTPWAVMVSANSRSAKMGPFNVRKHPSWCVPRVEIDDHIQVVVRPLRRSQQFRYVPRPHLIRAEAISSGFTRAGWVAWRRRSDTSPSASRIWYIVDVDAKYTPSSSSFAYTVAGASSTCCGSWRTRSISLRSTSSNARDWGAGIRSGFTAAGLLRCHR
jgi:hypothetical protein